MTLPFRYGRTPSQYSPKFMSHIDIVTPEPLAHPSPLLAIAHLFGLETPNTDDIRVLEFDCGDGGNIISIASSMPGAQCIGIGESSEAIDRGNNLVTKAGLENVKLICGNHNDIPIDGQFDVILIKNVYSRTSLKKRTALLKEAASYLNENGIILIEHLCLPGWAFKEPLRQQVQYHLRNEEDPVKRVLKGRQYLHALAACVPDHLTLYKALAQGEKEVSNQIPDLNFSLEYLEEDITPSFFHEFAATLEGADLQYVAEADLESMMINRFPREMAAILPEDATLVDTGQYIDFATNRSRRFSIICPTSREVTRNIEPDIIKSLCFSMSSSPVDSAAVMADSETSLYSQAGSIVTLKSKASKAALLVLTEHSPVRLTFDKLTKKVEEKIGELSKEDLLTIAESLTACVVSGIAGIDANPGPPAANMQKNPVASNLARAQAAESMPYVSSAYHNLVEIDRIACELLQILDGSHSREDLTAVIVEKIASGELSAETPEGQKIEDEIEIKEAASRQIDQFLSRFAANGLLSE